MRLTFTVPGQPRPKARPRLGRGGRTYTPRRTQAHEQTIAGHAVVARPAGWPRSASYRLEVVLWHGDRRRRDLDNCVKAVADALSGVLWDDDSMVVELMVRAELDRDAPRTEVTVEVMT